MHVYFYWVFTVHVHVCYVFFQTALAPPDVQQQYLSSIQHLLGDGRIHKQHITIKAFSAQSVNPCLNPPLTSFFASV